MEIMAAFLTIAIQAVVSAGIKLMVPAFIVTVTNPRSGVDAFKSQDIKLNELWSAVLALARRRRDQDRATDRAAAPRSEGAEQARDDSALSSSLAWQVPPLACV